MGGVILSGLFGFAVGVGVTLLGGVGAYVVLVLNPWARRF